MFSISAYGKMILDSVRMDAFAKALQEAVSPHSAVLDLGTGTGIFALLACQFGAKRVYAVETNPVAIQVAREAARENGYSDRISFIEGCSTEVSLPEQVDVVISDLRDVLPWYGVHFAAVADARRRFLVPGGTMIPLREALWIGCIESTDFYNSLETPWIRNAYGVNLGSALKITKNEWHKVHARPGHLLTQPTCCGTYDHWSVEAENFKISLSMTATRGGVCHGFCVWSELELATGIVLSNAPGSSELIYGQAFFPLQEGVAVAAGDSVHLTLRADWNGLGYAWSWDSSVRACGANPETKASFRQSEYLAAPISMPALRRQRERFVPVLNLDGRLVRHALDMMDGQRPLGDIASLLRKQFPARFPSSQAALAWMSEQSAKYGR